MAGKTDSGKIQPVRPRPRWRLLFWLFPILIVCAFIALNSFGMMFSKMDDPHRLNGEIHLIQSNGFTIRWVEKPAVNAVIDLVFIHGSPGGAGMWESQFSGPFPHANLFSYDRPGFGASKPCLVRPHLQEQVDGLMTWLPQATTNRVLLVGHSYGGPIALLAALQHPEKISGILLIGGDVDPAEEKPYIVSYIFGTRLTSWLLPRALRECNREMLTVKDDLEKVQKLLPQLKVPVIMLHGNHDPLVPVENVAWLEQQLKAAGKGDLFTKLIFPAYNHFIPWEHPEAVEQAIGMLAGQSGLESTNLAGSLEKNRLRSN